MIQNSTAVSTQKGNAAYLLKVGSKRRRTRVELEELKREEADRDGFNAQRDAHVADLERQLNASKRRSEMGDANTRIIEQMLEAGFIVRDDAGNYQPAQQQQQ